MGKELQINKMIILFELINDFSFIPLHSIPQQNACRFLSLSYAVSCIFAIM